MQQAIPITFVSPWYLGLLALLPLVWYFGFRSLAGLGRSRRALALLLRSAVLVLLVLAVAEVQWVLRSDRLAVIYLLDESLSVPAGARNAAVAAINESIQHERRPGDRAGAIAFGRQPMIEIPPVDENIQLPPTTEGRLDPGYTNLAGAIKLAQASFPEDSARRIVIVSDGNENVGSAKEQAELAVASGIGIDVYPIARAATAEAAVDKIVVPSEIRRGQPFEMRIALSSRAPDNSPAEAHKPIGGRLIVSERTDDRVTVLSDQHILLPPGKRVFTLRHQIDQPQFYTYEARFVPDNAADDTFAQNNRATAFTHVRGRGQVLLIEDDEQRGQHDMLVDDLRTDNLEMTVWSSKQLFTSLSELQRFDSVILANVPRDHFSDEQIGLLASNTHELGCGLVMLGGPGSMGAGGWANTEVEKAMPVDFTVKNVKVVPTGALALVIDHSGSMMGQKLEMSKAAAIAATKMLSPRDWVGVVAFDSMAHWIVPMQQVKQADRIAHQISRLQCGGGTNMQPGMAEAYRAIRSAPAAVKHVVVLTDGHTEGAQYEQMAAAMLRGGITTTCVALGSDAATELLANVARAGGGKFYSVNDPRAIPRIFMKEAMRVARPLVYEDERGFVPKLKYTHEITRGIAAPLPPLTGFVMSTVKHNPLVEVAIVSPVPQIEENTTILAAWTYGLGKAVTFASDAGARWAKAWTRWPGYSKLFGQMVRWSLRPTGEQGKFIVSTSTTEGKVNVFVTALDKNNEFLNFLDLDGSVVGPGGKRQIMDLEQTAAGKYAGSFESDDAGSYFVAIGGGHGKAPSIHGVNVPYSAEFRDSGTNEQLLESLAAMTPEGGSHGVVIGRQAGSTPALAMPEANSFRHDLPKAQTMLDVWPTLVWLAGLLFFADLFVRRVALEVRWIGVLAGRVRNRLLRREAHAPSAAYIGRLRSRKAEVSQTLEQQRAAARLDAAAAMTRPEASDSDSGDLDVLVNSTAEPATRPAAPAAGLSPDKPVEDDTYTGRLLKAKRQVWKERDKPN